MQFQVIPRLREKGCLSLGIETAERLGCLLQKVGFLRWGASSVPVKVCVSEEVEAGEIWLSNDVVEELSLPLFCHYELRRQRNEFRIGPMIGIAAVRTQAQLTRIVSSLTNYVYEYSAIGGAVLAFSLDGVDMSQRKIRGFLYNPETAEWTPGVYGYPGVVFKRVGMSEKLRAHFQEVVGQRVFNDTIFDKWEMYEWLSCFPQVERHLPDSLLYKDPSDLWKLLERHEHVFVKPIRGSQGLGVLKVSKEQSTVVVHFEHEGKQQTTKWEDREQAALFLKNRLARGRYLVQQGLELLKKGDQVIDFRLIVLKNRFGEWEHMGAVAREGTPGRIVSNVTQGGTAEMADVTLQKHLGLERDTLFGQLEHMADVALEAARCLEVCGVLAGNLGVDMAIDRAGKLWILEINNLDPNHTIALDANNRQLFYRVKRENMLYAKWLAGFGDEE